MAVDPPSIATSGPGNNEEDFDIVTTYRTLLSSDPDLTMPVAAIESLVLALSHRSTSTVSETLEYLSALSKRLIASTPNPISLSAGTDLFQRYIVNSLNRPEGDFGAVQRHLLSNGRVFVDNAKTARDRIARLGRHFVKGGSTVLTMGGSRVVGALLREAAEASGGVAARFSVIYVLPSLTARGCEGSEIVRSLREKGVPVATITSDAVAYCMGKVDMVIVGAEGVVENGGVISRMGTYQIALLAKSKKRPVHVVAESHKFVRLFPLGQYDLPIRQRVLEFTTEENGDEAQRRTEMEDAVDFTPPELISGIVTESGVLTPSAVSEELIKLWF